MSATTCRKTSSTRWSAFYKNREALAKSDPGFTPMAKDFVGMQVNGINANPDIPVHPGLAKFLKETQGLERQVEGTQDGAYDGADFLPRESVGAISYRLAQQEHRSSGRSITGASRKRRRRIMAA
jgi:hypothetical protein